MKKLLLLWLMIAPMSGMAQNESTPQDTTLYVNGRKIVIKEQGDKIKVKLYESASGGDTITNAQIFEGVYLNGQSTESRTVLSALPFSKKNNKRNRFEPHAGGFYIGYTRLSNDFLSFNPSNGADLNTSHSWDLLRHGGRRTYRVQQKPSALFLLPHSALYRMANTAQRQRSFVLCCRSRSRNTSRIQIQSQSQRIKEDD